MIGYPESKFQVAIKKIKNKLIKPTLWWQCVEFCHESTQRPG